MKKIVALLLVAILLISMASFLVGCGEEKNESSRNNSAQDKLDSYRESAERAAEQAQKARDDYNKLVDDINRYNTLMDKLNNAKPAH